MDNMEDLVGVVVGVLFGILLEKSRVSDPRIIRMQMVMENQRMMKTFFAALATSSLVLSGVYISFKSFFKQRLSKTKLLSNALGGFVLGIGMVVAGGCPGTLLAQFGSGRVSGMVGIVGCFIGATLYVFAHKFFAKKVDPIGDYGEVNLAPKKFWMIGVPFAVAMFLVVFLVDRFLVGNSEEMQPVSFSVEGYFALFTQKYWSPTLSGIGIGLLQFPTLIFGSTFLGSSTQYVQLIGMTIGIIYPPLKKHSYMKKVLKQKGKYFGLAVSFGIILGSLISSIVSGTFNQNLDATSYFTWKSYLMWFFGGILLLFGARIAGGCNSGHGISGISSQSLSSYVVTTATFGGGMSLAFGLKYAGFNIVDMK